MGIFPGLVEVLSVFVVFYGRVYFGCFVARSFLLVNIVSYLRLNNHFCVPFVLWFNNMKSLVFIFEVLLSYFSAAEILALVVTD